VGLIRPNKYILFSSSDKEEHHITGESTASRFFRKDCRAVTATCDIPLQKNNPETYVLQVYY